MRELRMGELGTSEGVGIMTDREIYDLLENGGIRLCDYAIEQWQSGKYTGGNPLDPTAFAQITENTVKFEKAKTRVREVVGELRRSAKGKQ